MKKLAVCGILFDDEYNILTVSRKNDPNKIGMVGGKVDDGETLEDAIIRECFEETGIKVKIKDNRPTYTDIDGDYEVTCFQLERIDSTTYPVSENETGIVKFVPVGELLSDKSPFYQYNINAISMIVTLENYEVLS